MDDAAANCGALFNAAVFLVHFNDLLDHAGAPRCCTPLNEVLLLSLLAATAEAKIFIGHRYRSFQTC
jgi:hypothetical protein